MGHTWIASGTCLHPRIGQLTRKQLALVPERIELCRDHEGGREAGQVIGLQRRGIRMPAIGRIRQIRISCELVRCPANEIAISEQNCEILYPFPRSLALGRSAVERRWKARPSRVPSAIRLLPGFPLRCRLPRQDVLRRRQFRPRGHAPTRA